MRLTNPVARGKIEMNKERGSDYDAETKIGRDRGFL